MGRKIWGLSALMALGGCADGMEQPAPSARMFKRGGGTRGVAGGFPGGGGSPIACMPALPSTVFSAPQLPLRVSGGTLVVLEDSMPAIVSDPNRDEVLVVDTQALSVT